MNEKLQYAEMLDIPVSTCNVTYKQPKKKLFKKKEKITQDKALDTLIEKVNENVAEQPLLKNAELDTQIETAEITPTEQTAQVKKLEKKPKKFKLSVVGVELVVICLLIATIFITNTLHPQSGINTFFGNVLGITDGDKVDQRVYSDFDVHLTPNTGIVYNEGVITLSGKASVYSPCDGTVSSVFRGEDGKFNMTVKHNGKFSTVITGLDLSYVNVGDGVYSNVPVGFVRDGGATLCFTDENDAVIVNYTLNDNQVVWEK